MNIRHGTSTFCVLWVLASCGGGGATDAETQTATGMEASTTVSTGEGTAPTTTGEPGSTGAAGTTSMTATSVSSSGSTTDVGEATSDTGGSSTGEPLPEGARRFRFINACDFTIFVGSLGNPIAPAQVCANDEECGAERVCDAGNSLCTWVTPMQGGWELPAAATHSVVLPPAWGGRFWPRTGCDGFNENGVPACQTGDCAGHLGCPVGVGGSPPATLAEFTLIPPDMPVGRDFYDVSNVDGANVPMRIDAVPGTFDPAGTPGGLEALYYCGSPGCVVGCGLLAPCPWDLEATCPPELRQIVDGKQVGCRSPGIACAIDPGNPVLDCAGKNDLYGCVPGGPNNVEGSCYSQPAAATCCGCPSWSPPGACNNNNPAWQLPSAPETYAKVFKDACPTAYSFPYDDLTSTFTCQGLPDRNVDYDITFCP